MIAAVIDAAAPIIATPRAVFHPILESPAATPRLLNSRLHRMGAVGGSPRAGRLADASSPCPNVRAEASFAGFRFQPDVIMLAVRWYLRYSLSYRDLEELLTKRGISGTVALRMT